MRPFSFLYLFVFTFLLLLLLPNSLFAIPRGFLRIVDTEPGLIRYPSGKNFVVTAESEEDARRLLSRSPGISSAPLESDRFVKGHETPNDSLFDLQWPYHGRVDIGGQEAWELASSAEGILVAFIDSGCDLHHPELNNNLWKNPGEIPDNGRDDDENGYVDDTLGYDFLNRDSEPQDESGHGTMGFGIAGASGDNGFGIAGVVWKLKIMCLKVLGPDTQGNLSDGIEAMEYALAQGARVINLTWGYVPGPGEEPSRIFEEAIEDARDQGVLVVASAGNNGASNDGDPSLANYPSSFTFDNIISVTATDPEDALPPFANYGKENVDLAAPGVGILTTALHGGFAYFEGTSAAAPFVTGTAALLWSLNPSLSYRDVKKSILDHSDPVEGLQEKTQTGGRLNIARALGVAKETSVPIPPLPAPTDPTFSPAPASGGCSLRPEAEGGFILSALLGLPFANRWARKAARGKSIDRDGALDPPLLP